MILSRLSIKHPAVVIILLAALVVFSLLALTTLNRGLLPELSRPLLFVSTIYPGAGAEQVQEEITGPLEDSFITIPGLKTMEGESLESASLLTLEFEDNLSQEQLLPVVREKINLIRKDLPEEIEGEPLIRALSSSTAIPILVVNVSSSQDAPRSIEEISRITEETVLPRLNGLSGVAEVTPRGLVPLVVEIRLNPLGLVARGISPLEVMGALEGSNRSIPAGTVSYRGESLNLQTLGRFPSLESLEQLPVGLRGSEVIRLKEVARVEISRERPESYTVSENREVITLEITRREGADTLRTVSRIREELRLLGAENALDFTVLKDESDLTGTSIRSVVTAALLGIALAVLVLLLFLRDLRSTLIISVSLPLSLLFTLPGMFLAGQTINILSLSGMTVALGMIVDASIVMLESIHGCRGLPREEAAREGARRIGGAVLASATTTLSVFIPLLFLGGITGLFMKDISLTLIFCLAASTLVALTVIPFLASRRGGGAEKPIVLPAFLTRSSRKKPPRNFYRTLLEKSLTNRRFLFLTAGLLLAVSALALTQLGTAFIPHVDSGEIEISWEYPRGTSLEETRRRIASSEALFRSAVPEIAAGTITLEAGRGKGLFTLVPSSERKRSVFTIIEELQSRARANLAGTEVTLFNGGIDSLVAIGAGGQGFILELSGTDLTELDRAAREAEAYLARRPGVLSVNRNVTLSARGAAFQLDLEGLANLGLSPREVGLAGRILFHGVEGGTFRIDRRPGLDSGWERYGRPLSELPDTLEIRISSARRNEPVTENHLNSLYLKTPAGAMVALNSLGDLEIRERPERIFRKNRRNVILVTAALASAETGRLSRKMESWFSPPEGIEWTIQGPGGLLKDSLASLFLVLGVSLFLVYAVMVIQFERFVQPLIIMASIPFTLIGITASLLLFGSEISIISFLGIIALGGVVVNNAIVLLDAMNRLREEEGYPLREAVLEGARRRLKPVLMTTLTTVLGVTPMAFGGGAASELYGPLGQVIFGGLITSTAITLILIPLLYYTVEERLERKRAYSVNPRL